MTDQQHIIDDLTQVNTVVRHTATELHAKVVALRDTLEEQFHADVDAVIDLVTTITQAAHSTASAATIAAGPATVVPTVNLGAGVDLAALAAEASAKEDAAAAAAAPAVPVTAEQLGDDTQTPPVLTDNSEAAGVDVPDVDAPNVIVGSTAGEGEVVQVAPGTEGEQATSTEPIARRGRR